MNPSQPLISAVFALFAAYFFMGAWDGVVRRHIRIRPGEQLQSLIIGGPIAFFIGILSFLLLTFLTRMALSGLPILLAGCHTFTCSFGRVALLPFTTVQSIAVMLLTAVLFFPWLWGMFDREGPFRTRLLAPRVWYREREVVTLARQHLEQRGQANVDTDVLLEMADRLLRGFHGVSPTMSGTDTAKTPVTRDMVVRSLTHSSLVRKHQGATQSAQRIIIEAMAPYIIDKLEAAEKRWPWRRRLLATIR